MNLRTRYLGLDLRTPLVPAASPLSENLDELKRLEDAGAPAVVFHSLFEEQIRQESRTAQHFLGFDPAEASTVARYFPEPNEFHFTPERYLQKIAAAKEALDIPIIGSLNGSTFGGWMSYAREMEQAGADALELNLYSIPTDPDLSAEEIETAYLTVITSVKAQVKIPVAVKLSPFFTNFAGFARRVDRLGVEGLVLFNRFYQPDIELATLRVTPNLNLSSAGEIRLPLRWIAMLRGRVKASLAATSGVHRGSDAAKLLLAGADVTMLCSVLLRKGVDHLRVLEEELRDCGERHGFHSVNEIKGKLCQINCPDPSAFERAQYIRAVAVDRAIQPAA